MINARLPGRAGMMISEVNSSTNEIRENPFHPFHPCLKAAGRRVLIKLFF
jgi:hypothetical protein